MQLLVKPRNINKLYKYEEVGANAFLFGIEKFSINPTSVVNPKVLKYLKKKLNKNTKIFVSIDKNIFNNDINNLKKILLELEKIKIDGLFFYDLAILNIVNEMKLNINLIWNQNYFVTNYSTCNFYYDNNVKGAVISSELDLNEIIEITKNTKTDLFLNIFGYQLISFSKRKLITNYFKILKKRSFKIQHYLIQNNKKYLISEGQDGTAILSSSVLNGIRYINDLKKERIKYLILDEKCLKKKVFLKILEIYSNCLIKKVTNKFLTTQEDRIKNYIPNTSLGFLDKKTIYKVKKYE